MCQHYRLTTQAKIAVPVACLDLACSEAGYPFDRTAAVKVAAVTKKVYLDTVKHLAAALYPNQCAHKVVGLTQARAGGL